jgi:hypothetical protein
MYFVYVSENRIIKPVEIILRRGRDGAEGRTKEGVSLNKVHCKHI